MSESSVDKTFLGKGWSFPPEFDKRTKAVKMVAYAEDIQESLKILLSTVPGERVMQPTFGCGLKELIFENISESVITEIKDVIERAVLFFESRITLESVDVNTESVYEGFIKIRLNYTIKTTNSRSNIVYPFYFNEGTNISL
jgi:phage baseplate assembly protein W